MLGLWSLRDIFEQYRLLNMVFLVLGIRHRLFLSFQCSARRWHFGVFGSPHAKGHHSLCSDLRLDSIG
jgi:hypothetical protein